MGEVNHCSSCGMCCKLLGVQEIAKPPHEWCRHYRKGTGCTIHEQPDFPADCRDYVCLWRQMKEEGQTFPDELRPDRCKVIIDAAKDAPVHYVRCDPAYPNAWRQQSIQNVLGELARIGSEIYLITRDGPKRLRVIA